jgi:hypothetical protein
MERRWIWKGSMLGLFCTAAQLSPHAAFAEEASATETAAARSLAIEGLKLAQSGNCVDATPKLERAEKLYHSTVVAGRLGECYVSLGRLVEGTEILRRTLREPLPAEPTPALTKGLERAQRVLDSAKPRIAGLTIKIVAVDDLVVKVDGEPVPAALLDTEIPSDPGEHGVEATAPGFSRATARVSMGEGERRTVTLTLTRDPEAVRAAAVIPKATSVKAVQAPPAAPAVQRAHDDAPASAKPNRVPAFVALGLGAATIGAGAVMGTLALTQHQELEKACTGGVCPPDKADDLDAAKRLGTFSTVAFGVGAAGVVLGTVLLFTASSGDADRADVAHNSRRFAGLSRPRAALGPTSIQLGADF